MRPVSGWSRTALMLMGVVFTPVLTAQEKPKAAKAIMVVKVVEDATLFVDGKERDKPTGAVRRFNTPPLEPGQRYYYMVAATWELNSYTKCTRTRKVIVEAGKTAEVDMSKKDANPDDEVVIIYVPTPQTVVNAMLKLGNVTKDDVVYDLGCGDGRIVVTAVGKFGAKHGVGVDLDPKRIEESNKNAKAEGVEGKIEFRKGDVLKVADLDKATVVCLYLADELNELLRPILLKALKPGARIVSHRFLMGDWKPDKTETHTVGGTEFKIHLWTIKKPAAGEKDKEEKDKEKKDKEKDAKDSKDKDAKEKADKDKEKKDKE